MYAAVCTSLVPRPSTPPAFDRFQYAKTGSDQKLEVWKAWARSTVSVLKATLALFHTVHFLLANLTLMQMFCRPSTPTGLVCMVCCG